MQKTNIIQDKGNKAAMFIGNGLHHFEDTVMGISSGGNVLSWNHQQEKILEIFDYGNRNFKLGNAAVIKSSFLPCESTCKIETNGI